VRARRDGEAGPRAMVASAEADKAAPPGRARGRGSRAGPDGAMAGERKEGGKGERREGLTARRGRTASRERETCVGGKGRGEREIKEDAVWGESGADGRAPPRGGGGGGSTHAREKGGGGLGGGVGLTGGPHQGVAAAAVLPTRAARAGRVEGVGAVRPPRRQAGPRRGWATRGEGKEEGERAACLARPREAHGGEGRGAGWATAGSWPKKGGEREIPLFYSFPNFPI
jgi:hypothetical protein